MWRWSGHLHLDPNADREELEVALASVRVVDMRRQATNSTATRFLELSGDRNSNAIRGALDPDAPAGAVARTMLVSAAAEKWGVGAASCRARNGEFIHTPTRPAVEVWRPRRSAAKLPVLKPESVALKPLIAIQTDRHAREAARSFGKVNARRSSGIDVMIPG